MSSIEVAALIAVVLVVVYNLRNARSGARSGRVSPGNQRRK